MNENMFSLIHSIHLKNVDCFQATASCSPVHFLVYLTTNLLSYRFTLLSRFIAPVHVLYNQVPLVSVFLQASSQSKLFNP